MITLPEIEISIRYKNKVKTSDLFTVKNSEDIVKVLREIYDDGQILWQENFIVVCLNRANKVIAFSKVSSGGLTGTVADPRIIIGMALQAHAAGIIISHNHPSGGLTPSNADHSQTQKLKEAAKLFDIQLLDHVILTDCGHYSFADEGTL